ncbi:unnamed protein product [Chrysodeixis includens]|uniref:Uncharacterized protein n=1 Tax=Chrysodeixis includens TaxID=689277 RepID=A0A9N8Q217_CHRIL|nr:unnamed protein product [Chrysodeixis includens]
MLVFRAGRCWQGRSPQGAISHPACYRSGPLTITDANLLLGTYTCSRLYDTVAAGGGVHADSVQREGCCWRGRSPRARSGTPATGALTVTDANLLAWYVVYSPSTSQSLRAYGKGRLLRQRRNGHCFQRRSNRNQPVPGKQDGGKEMTMEEVAMGFIKPSPMSYVQAD